MKKIKRRYIALTAFFVLILFYVLNLFLKSETFAPNVSAQKYFEYCIILLQLLFTVIVFKSKNNDTKNILTTLIVIGTGIYIVIYLYNLMVT